VVLFHTWRIHVKVALDTHTAAVMTVSVTFEIENWASSFQLPAADLQSAAMRRTVWARWRRPLSLLVVALAAAVSVRGQDIDAFVTGWLEQQHVPALAVAVIKDGAVVKLAGYGLADVEHRVPARPDTVFKIGSVSKQFIAAGIMLLAQDGRLGVDDNVSKYIDGIPEAWGAMTLRHLLTHTAGLPREAPGFDPQKAQPDLDVIRTAYAGPLASPPGENHVYSNLGYFMLAEVITKVSGKAWGTFLGDRIFVPLGMTATRVTSLPDIVVNRAHGYAWRRGRLENEDDWPAVRPSGAFLSTVDDLAKWELALSGDRILTEASKRQMWTALTLKDGRTVPYGFGWQLDDWPADSKVPTGVPMIRHGGSMNGFRAGYTRWPSHRLTVIVLTNLTNAPYEGLAANLAIRYVPQLATKK
jgi:CubicO group peptidase (beta-lactamase class C family)